MRRDRLPLALALGLASCPTVHVPDAGQPRVARSLAISADAATLWVVNTDSDFVSRIDLASRTLTDEIALSSTPPARDPATQRYEPSVRPRSIALVDSLGKAYVAGQAANRVFVVDTHGGTLLGAIPVGAEPTALVASADGAAVYVVNHESATVQKIDTKLDAVVATVEVGEHPWGASLRADGSALYVTQFLLNPGVTIVDTAAMTVAAFTPLPDQPVDPRVQDILIPSGQARSVYAVVPRPDDGELWVPHLLLATTTPEPALAFNTTAFPTVTRLSPGGWNVDDRLLLRTNSLLTASGSFTDVVSGPRDLAFTPDGSLALMANAQSEDVLVFDAQSGYEVGLVRPTPSTLIEGIAIDATGKHAYLQGRNSHDVTVLDIAAVGGTPVVTVDGLPIECLAAGDPVPPTLRHGQRLFYTANSSYAAVTQNFWMACAICHPEGQSDAVTWQFVEGPRDTPSNAGGPLNTGFLYRQAVRNDVKQYAETINAEQGGSYVFPGGSAQQLQDLQDLADFTNYAIAFPQNPNVNADGSQTASQAHGQTLFSQMTCVSCHRSPTPWPAAGDFYTDSGAGNPTLDFGGVITLHDVGTCVTGGAFPDQPFSDFRSGATACDFDTPTLRGIFATRPYFHDGSSATLDDAVARMLTYVAANGAPNAAELTESDKSDLVEYLKSL